jgi:hypothetical protein
MRNQKLTDKYTQIVESRKPVKESPQTMPAPTKPKAPPAPGTKPTTPAQPAKPADPFFPKPGQSPRPKAVKVIKEEETCAGCGKPVNDCECETGRTVETEAGNRSLERFVAKRTHYTQ